MKTPIGASEPRRFTSMVDQITAEAQGHACEPRPYGEGPLGQCGLRLREVKMNIPLLIAALSIAILWCTAGYAQSYDDLTTPGINEGKHRRLRLNRLSV